MSFLYTFQDMRDSCQHFEVCETLGNQKVPICGHPENRNINSAYGYCDENVCPIVRHILDEGKEWE